MGHEEVNQMIFKSNLGQVIEIYPFALKGANLSSALRTPMAM